MEIIEVTDSIGKNDFSVKKFIRRGEKHYVEIQPDGKAYRIRISYSDYIKGLRAYYSSMKISCYPLDGVLINDTFEDVIYEMEFKNKL